MTLPLETFRRQKLVLVFVLIGGSGLVQCNEQESLVAASNETLGSTPILRTLSLRLILSQRSVHVEAQALQP